MKAYVDRKGTPEALQELFETALREGPVGCLLVLSCDENAFTPEVLDPILKAVPVPLFGGTFPAIISEHQVLTRGSIVVSMERSAEIYHVSNISDPEVDIEAVLDSQVGEEECKTLLVFMDGLASRIKVFIDSLYTIFGLEINYVGAGAGSASLIRKACLITNKGLVKDSAVLATLDMESGVGVRHGWTSISGPYKVTESEGNAIISLDWHPALEVYRAVVEAYCGCSFDDSPFLNIAKGYPFGIEKLGAEKVVRDPVGLDKDGNMVCVGECPAGEYVDILHGRPSGLVKASGDAMRQARADLPDSVTPGLRLFLDCFSRLLFLDDAYAAELDAVTSDDVINIGVCSIGEIANSGKDYLEFYNKTSVIALLEGE
ncbi:FIST signal transduction protein [Pseudodesulfovibrio sediminis]|nr:FIST N-terminal domain-containing protein [Pseudodesulfovibrio sediminis]